MHAVFFLVQWLLSWYDLLATTCDVTEYSFAAHRNGGTRKWSSSLRSGQSHGPLLHSIWQWTSGSSWAGLNYLGGSSSRRHWQAMLRAWQPRSGGGNGRGSQWSGCGRLSSKRWIQPTHSSVADLKNLPAPHCRDRMKTGDKPRRPCWFSSGPQQRRCYCGDCQLRV